MSGSIARSVQQVKREDLRSIICPNLIVTLCSAAGHLWRDRTLGPVQTIFMFLTQILHGNTACSAMSRLAGVSFTGPAYCAARMRLPLALFEDLLERVCEALHPDLQETGRWRGHRTWSLDGSSFSMSDTPIVQPKTPPMVRSPCENQLFPSTISIRFP